MHVVVKQIRNVLFKNNCYGTLALISYYKTQNEAGAAAFVLCIYFSFSSSSSSGNSFCCVIVDLFILLFFTTTYIHKGLLRLSSPA